MSHKHVLDILLTWDEWYFLLVHGLPCDAHAGIDTRHYKLIHDISPEEWDKIFPIYSDLARVASERRCNKIKVGV